MNKIKEGYLKFKQDFIPKVFYDIAKWILGLLIAWCLFKIFKHRIQIKDAFLKNITLDLTSILLICIFCITLTTIIVISIYSKKIQKLKDITYTDSKTGLKNYKLLESYLKTKISESILKNAPLSVIIIDIDDFKNFNEHYSPTIGDKIIAEVGRLLLHDTRITDETFRRYETGDEFVVISTNTNLTQAKNPAERKREFIANNNFVIDGTIYKITVSCGIAEYKSEADTLDTLLDRANYAMRNIAKKKNGKNCTESVS
ncbi:GGDEF domain-containing protein [Flavobacterium zepuense]|uniref:diguanylate cyclase n=1 Tax=Flavobacterium zepuense TaxID=2593302 RepID=A0A552UZI1_9FLAO|nr:GGDEF domain-containing protein [Flavobacterium zepuense]TRW23627.1 GGDEF domain-containing protein [Flavobacterium zepuense]